MKRKLPWFFRFWIGFFTEAKRRKGVLSRIQKTYLAQLECLGKHEALKYLLREMLETAIEAVWYHLRIGLVIKLIADVLNTLWK